MLEVDRRVDHHLNRRATLVSFGREQAALVGTVGEIIGGKVAFAASQMVALLDGGLCAIIVAFAQNVVVHDAGGEAGVYDVDLAIEESARRSSIRMTRIGPFPTFYNIEWDAF